MTSRAIADALESCHDKLVSRGSQGLYKLSVNACDGLDVEQISRLAKRPNDEVRATTVASIEAAGWHIAETPGRRDIDGHCEVFCDDATEMPSAEVLDALASIWEPPQANLGKP